MPKMKALSDACHDPTSWHAGAESAAPARRDEVFIPNWPKGKQFENFVILLFNAFNAFND
jgi:hypothetical protein